MRWIFSGRTTVSDDGRFRVAKVFRGWILYDRGIDKGDFPSLESAVQHAEYGVQVEQRRASA